MNDEIDRICAITESSNLEFPKTKLAIATFIQHNSWFNGRILILTLESNPLTEHNIKLLYQYYNDIEIREITDVSNNDKLSESDKLDYLRIHAFNIKSKGNLYFSRRSIFNKNISDSLNNESISSFELGNYRSREILFSFDDIDSDFMFIPYSYISNNIVSTDSHPNVNSAINNHIKLYNLRIKKDMIIVKSSDYPDNKYSEFVRYHNHIYIVIINTFNSSQYTRITLYWISINKKINDIKPSNVPRKVIDTITTPFLSNIDKSDIKISIIIPAYKAGPYIKECIDSIINQDTKATFEILIGIDNCKDTLSTLTSLSYDDHMLNIYYSDKSVGPYVLRNSLINLAKYDNILFFDADDVMKYNMISTILKYYTQSSPIRFKLLNFNDGDNYLVNHKMYYAYAYGVFFSHINILDKIGGFKDWICGADAEFMTRCKNNKIIDVKINEAIFYRRRHNNSLTQNAATNNSSSIRQKAVDYINRNKDWSIPIPRTMTKLKYIK